MSAVDLSQATVVCDHLPLWPALKSEVGSYDGGYAVEKKNASGRRERNLRIKNQRYTFFWYTSVLSRTVM